MRESSLSKLLNVFDTILKVIEESVMAYGIICIALISIANVIGRNFFNYSLMFSEEVCQSAIILITFIGTAYAARKGRHIRMSAFYDMLRAKHRKILIIIISFITSFIMFYLFVLTSQYTLIIKVSTAVLPVLRLPTYLVLVWAPFGLAIAGIEFALTILANLIKEEVFLSSEVKDVYEDEKILQR